MIKEFQNPPVYNRVRPFWFLNGDLKEKEIEHQITEMKEKGLGGFVMCARQGLTVPYLSEEWFRICRFAVKTAKNLGMEVWLYDEFPYPSGISGGEVTIRHPESCQHELVFTDTITENGRAEIPLGKVRNLSAFAYPVREGETKWEEGMDVLKCIGIVQPIEIFQYNDTEKPVLNRKRYFSYGPEKKLAVTLPEGCWRIITASAKKIADFKYYGDFIDPADSGAVETFIETTYEAYKKALGDEFGRTIKGIYGDETHFLGEHFWSFQLPDYYQKKYGEDLIPLLGAVHDKYYPNAAKIRYRYFQCMHELLRDRYHKKLYEWCEENGIWYATEIPVMRMSGQMYSHVPGGDPNHDKLGVPLETVIDRDFLGIRSNTKLLSAIARQYNREDSLVESFHSIGWSMTLQDAKWLIDRETLMGASFHVFHAFYYTMDGMTKHDAAPSQFLQNPYWEYYKKLADYCGRSARFITQTDFAAKTAVFHPMTSWWTSLINPMLRMKYTGNDAVEKKEIERLMEDYLCICKSLLFHQIDYDDIDAETMAEGVMENGRLCVGKAVYDTIIVPPVKNMEGFAEKLLKDFAACGGKVIFCGLTPYEEIDGCKFSDEFAGAGDFLQKLNQYYYEQGQGKAESAETFIKGVYGVTAPGGMVQSCAGEVLADFVKRLSPATTELHLPASAYGKIVSCRRMDAEYDYLFVTSCDGQDAKGLITLKETKPICEMDLETGESHFIGNRNCFEMKIGPWETKLYAIAKDSAVRIKDFAIYEIFDSAYDEDRGEKEGSEKQIKVLELPLEKEVKIEMKGLNVLRLERFTLSVNGSPEFETVPLTFIEQIKRGSTDLTNPVQYLKIDFSGGFGFPTRVALHYPVQLAYRTSFLIDSLPEKLFLMHDNRAVLGEYVICINGNSLPAENFVSKRIYDCNNKAADILSFVKKGRNEIAVSVTATEQWHGLSDPFYLLGDFGVITNDTIGKKTDRGYFTASVPESYRFYSGKIAYTFELELPKGAVVFRIPQSRHFYECATLYVDDREIGTRAFAPYEWMLPAEENRKNKCRITLVVTNTLIHMLEGAYYDYEKQQLVKYSYE